MSYVHVFLTYSLNNHILFMYSYLWIPFLSVFPVSLTIIKVLVGIWFRTLSFAEWFCPLRICELKESFKVMKRMKKEMATLAANIKNAHSKQLNFEHGFRPIYYFSRAAGLWPFSICRDSNGVIQPARLSRLDGAWFFISLCLHLFAMFYYYLSLVELEGSNKTILTFSILYTLFQIKSLLIGAFGIILDLLNRYTLVNLLRKFIVFDSEVGHFIHDHFYSINIANSSQIWSFKQMAKFGIYFNYKNDSRRAFAYLFVPSVITVTLIIASNITYEIYANKSIYFILFEDIINLRPFIWIPIVISFTTFIRGLLERFVALNTLLRYSNMFKFNLIDIT